MFDPLEQFNILGFNCIFCQYSQYLLDNVSAVVFLNINLIHILIGLSFLTISLKSVIQVCYMGFFFSVIELLNSIFTSNMLFKKQIFMGFLINLFFFILYSNTFGMIPYSVTVTSYFALTFFFAAVTFFSVTLVGIFYNKFEFFKVFLPGGVPLVISVFLIIIECISYVSKVLSLSIRLFANMMSGHTLLKILLSFSWAMFMSSSILAVMGGIPLLVVFAVTFLECMIAFLQAYIFIVLSSIYFNEVIHLH